MKFKEFVLEEGEFFDALKHGIKTGFNAFKVKRQEQKKESKDLRHKVLSAEGKELESLIKQIVDNKFSIQKQCAKTQKETDWLLECTSTRTTSHFARCRPQIW